MASISGYARPDSSIRNGLGTQFIQLKQIQLLCLYAVLCFTTGTIQLVIKFLAVSDLSPGTVWHCALLLQLFVVHISMIRQHIGVHQTDVALRLLF